LDEPEFMEMVKRELQDGQHIRNPNSGYRGMGRSYFHLPELLEKELSEAGFGNNDIRGVIGPLWLIQDIDEKWKHKEKRETIMSIVRLLEKEQSIMGLSTHIVSISDK
jgi:hypothetical protein